MSEWRTEAWQQIDRLLDAALSLPADRRAPFVEQSGAPADIQDQVRRLLRMHEDAEARIGESAEAIASAVLDNGDAAQAPDFSAGAAIGPYTVVRELGRGGMGTVYLAERSDEKYDRQVALKVVKRGMDTDEVLERFRREGRILARLEHHGIGRMYDADVTEDGRPYLVLEHIEGEPIDDYCDGQRLGLEDRIRLFLQVCDAVSFAHQKLVLHRDLKPSNILVSDDGPCLLDFGVGKLLDERDRDGRSLTTEIGRRLTPEYASPEQIAGAEISTASDVYALGVVLYELVTGVRPTRDDPRTASSTVTETRRDVDPEALATVRRSTPRKLSKRLQGDLDLILMKALHVDVQRRYSSVEAFASDLRRHLGGFPVVARPDSVGYRVRKFVTRHRLPVWSGSGAVMSIGVFAVASFLQQAQTARERDRADLERVRAEEVASVLQDLFTGAGVSSPERIDTLSVRQFLDRSAEQVTADLEGEPVVQGTLLRILGSAQHGVGQLDEADRLLTRAVAVLESVSPLDERALFATKTELGRLRSSQGRWEESRALFDDFFTSGIDATAGDTAEVYLDLATSFISEARFDSASAWLDRSLELYANRDGLDRTTYAGALSSGALIAQRRGELPQAIELSERAWKIMAEARGPDHPMVFAYEHNHAFMIHRAGRSAEAEPVLASVVERQRQVVGESPDLAAALHSYGSVLQALGRHEETLPVLRESLAMRRGLLGPDHPQVTFSLDGLGTSLQVLERHDEALAAFREQLDVSLTAFGPNHPGTAVARTKVASAVCNAGGVAPEIVEGFRTAEEAVRAAFPPGHLAVTDLLLRKGRCYARLGREAEAIEALERAIAGLEASGSRQVALESAMELLRELMEGS